MKLAISASGTDIIDFRNSLQKNLQATTDVVSFNYSYGGLFGTVYDILKKNYEAVQEVAEIASSYIREDTIRAEQTIEHNEGVIAAYRRKLNKTNNDIRDCEQTLSRIRSEMAAYQGQLASVSSVSTDSAEAQRQAAQRAQYTAQINNCAARCASLQSRISELSVYKNKLETAIGKIEAANDKLRSFLYDLRSKERGIHDYTAKCSSIMHDVDGELSQLRNTYSKLKNMNEQYSEIARRAEEIVMGIDVNLSQASETSPNQNRKIEIAGSEFLDDIAKVLSYAKEKINSENDAVTELMAEMGRTMQDNVIRHSVKNLTKIRDVIEDRVADWEEKSLCFKRAARLLDEYVKL